MNFHRHPFCYRGEGLGGSLLEYDRLSATRCYLFDSSTGGGKSASQTTQTASGSGKTLSDHSTLVESGSIGVTGKGAQYREAGSYDAGKNNKNSVSYKLSKGASV